MLIGDRMRLRSMPEFRFKDDAKELANGYEGGIGLNRFNDIKVGDVMEAYEVVEKERD